MEGKVVCKHYKSLLDYKLFPLLTFLIQANFGYALFPLYNNLTIQHHFAGRLSFLKASKSHHKTRILYETKPHSAFAPTLTSSFLSCLLNIKQAIRYLRKEISRKMDIKSGNNTFSRDWENVEIEAREVDLNDMQFAVILIIWLIIEVFGNGMLIGLIVYEKEGNGDPLKRRITDQVKYYRAQT